MKKWLCWILLIVLAFFELAWLIQAFKITIVLLVGGLSFFPSVGYATGYISFTLVIEIFILYGIIYCIRCIRSNRNVRRR